jgi:flagellin-specific chaperone FliS
MNNIPNDVLEEIILNKVKLFTKESYYRHFRSILLEFYKNILAFKKKASLSITMTSKIKERNNKSLWHIISIIIFPLKSQLNEENSYEREYNLNPLCFQYLKNLCFTRMKKLTNLATIERVSMDRVIPIYLNLCEKHI